MTPDETKNALRVAAAAHGFQAFGVATVAAPLRREYYLRWIAGGQNAAMGWMERNNERRLRPENFLPQARSIVMLGLNSRQPPPALPYRVASYALGEDYHNFIFKRLKKLCALMRTWGGEQRPCVDTAPVMEKPIAEQAGLGWQGKNTLLVNREHGAWLLLGTIFTTLELPPDAPERNNCGLCSRCADACPTGALADPYRLDARRCLAYLTVEHTGDFPPEFREAAGNRLFGCDTCADVCPWNRRAADATEEKLRPRPLPPDLRDSLAWTPQEYDARFAGTPLKRLGLARWLRNACVVLGNTGTALDLPALEKLAAASDPAAAPAIASHAAWAIAKIKARAAAPDVPAAPATPDGG
ncbi:MAG: tRNA epoxyqueuosine(34) reductase QueG [Puniceicoccales bacterium]|jgi:epoxyqueuosine reductase|nr:tRNA epoxyqueuosine(34) reductase QueG [Puniceicoccales bacterium]